MRMGGVRRLHVNAGPDPEVLAYGLSFATGLLTVQADSVALTQPPGAIAAGSGFAQPVAVASLSRRTIALKKTGFLPTSLPDDAQAPVARSLRCRP